MGFPVRFLYYVKVCYMRILAMCANLKWWHKISVSRPMIICDINYFGDYWFLVYWKPSSYLLQNIYCFYLGVRLFLDNSLLDFSIAIYLRYCCCKYSGTCGSGEVWIYSSNYPYLQTYTMVVQTDLLRLRKLHLTNTRVFV